MFAAKKNSNISQAKKINALLLVKMVVGHSKGIIFTGSPLSNRLGCVGNYFEIRSDRSDVLRFASVCHGDKLSFHHQIGGIITIRITLSRKA